MSEQGSAEPLVDAIGGPADPAFIASCLRAMAGNPLLVRALARAVRDDGLTPTSDNVERVLDLRGRGGVAAGDPTVGPPGAAGVGGGAGDRRAGPGRAARPGAGEASTA